jgi:hypothetical protein
MTGEGDMSPFEADSHPHQLTHDLTYQVLVKSVALTVTTDECEQVESHLAV